MLQNLDVGYLMCFVWGRIILKCTEIALVKPKPFGLENKTGRSGSASGSAAHPSRRTQHGSRRTLGCCCGRGSRWRCPALKPEAETKLGLNFQVIFIVIPDSRRVFASRQFGFDTCFAPSHFVCWDPIAKHVSNRNGWRHFDKRQFVIL